MDASSINGLFFIGALLVASSILVSSFSTRIGIPVLHVQQLLGLSFGASPTEIGLDRHMVSARGLVQKLLQPSPVAATV